MQTVSRPKCLEPCCDEYAYDGVEAERCEDDYTITSIVFISMHTRTK
jgi:hypothetical protein